MEDTEIYIQTGGWMDGQIDRQTDSTTLKINDIKYINGEHNNQELTDKTCYTS